MPLSPGTRLGHYDVTALLGEGGMGQVWQATDTQLGREVALKILPDAFAADPDRLARFKREAQILASLNHPNIAAIYGIEEAEGTRALVLELVEGPTLADRIAKGPIPLDEALPIAKQIAEALEAAHEAGVIHRDLKPANIKVREDGTVKVLDFGLAKALDLAPTSDPSESPTLTAAATQMGVILGTAAYMSPEQARGKPVDKRTDIWAFGCVFYEMLTGRPAFEGETVTDTLAAVIRGNPDWAPVARVAPAAIQRLLRRCFEPDPRKRLRDIGDARHELEHGEEDGKGGAAGGLTVSTRRSLRLLPVWTALGTAGVAGAITWGLPARAPSVEAPVTRLQLNLPGLNAGHGESAVFALSPDGRTVVFEADGVLHLRRMDRLEPTPITGTEGGYSPFFSPDGDWVGFFTSTQLKKVALGGAASVTVAPVSNAWLGVWTVDDTIVFAQRGPTGLTRVSATPGSAPEVFTSLQDGDLHHHVPVAVLPDGHTIIFGILTDDMIGWDGAAVVAQSVRTNERVPLLDGGSMARYVASGHIVYASVGALLAAPFDIRQREVTGPAAVVVEGVRNSNRGGVAQWTVSQNGTLAYIGAPLDGGRSRVLVWVNPDGSEQTVGLEPRLYFAPRISPDGSRLVASVEDQDLNIDIQVYDLLRGAPLRRLSTFRGHDWAPNWTPDGTSIIYVSDERQGRVLSKPVDGSDEHVIAERWLAPQSWSPDGAWLAYVEVTNDAGRNIGLMSATDGFTPRPVLESPDDEHGPVISPEGHLIAYSSTESGRSEVYVSTFPEGIRPNRQRVSRDGGGYPVWSRDGAELFFRSGRAMMAVAIADGLDLSRHEPRELFSGDYVSGDLFGRSYDVHPDGRFLMMKEQSPSRPGELIIVQNWFEDLKRLVPVN